MRRDSGPESEDLLRAEGWQNRRGRYKQCPKLSFRNPQEVFPESGIALPRTLHGELSASCLLNFRCPLARRLATRSHFFGNLLKLRSCVGFLHHLFHGLSAKVSCKPLKFQGVFSVEEAQRDKISGFPF